LRSNDHQDDEEWRFETAENALGRIELFDFGEVGDVAGMHHERRLLWQRVDRVDRLVERAQHVGVRRKREADVAVADLHEREVAAGSCCRERTRRRHGEGDAAAGPPDMLEK
jgi:hypothetical protein